LGTFDEKDANGTCEEIVAEQIQTRTEYAALESQVTKSRREDQTAGYLSAVLFPPAALAIDQQSDAKKVLDEKQTRLDELVVLFRLKGCPQDSQPPLEKPEQ